MDGFDQVLIDVVGNEHPETLEAALKLVRLRFPETEEAVRYAARSYFKH